jgi:hypothetical protein
MAMARKLREEEDMNKLAKSFALINATLQRERREFNKKVLREARRARDREEEEKEDERKRKGKARCSSV